MVKVTNGEYSKAADSFRGPESLRLWSTADGGFFSAPIDRVRYWLAIGALIGLAVVAAILGWRRVVGAMTGPLPSRTMAVVAFTLVLVAALVRIGWCCQASVKPLANWWIPLVAVTVVAAAVTVPSTTIAATLVLWGAVAVTESIWLALLRPWRPAPAVAVVPLRIHAPAGVDIGRDSIESHQSNVISDGRQSPAFSGSRPPLNESQRITQELVRTQNVEGDEEISGVVVVDFAARQRTAQVHIAFCPPFAATPEMTVESEADYRLIQVVPYGTHLEFRRSFGVDLPDSIEVQFRAQSAS